MTSSTQQQPLISVLMPTYNRDWSLDRAIQSVLRQTYANWELIIVDDGSTDASEEILAGYVKDYPNIHAIFHRENRGQGTARNTAMDAAQGEWICNLDSDDELTDNALELLLRVNHEIDCETTMIIGHNYDSGREEITDLNLSPG
ncbi:MAG: glycosyltransferase, partial [Coriobacteriia bacterium]|nr:glycosyltransferase [Coriobacteriia bacterium]